MKTTRLLALGFIAALGLLSIVSAQAQTLDEAAPVPVKTVPAV